MPELPDVTVYIEALSERVLNQPIQKIRIGSPFVVRSFEPPIRAAEGKKVLALRRLGKRIVFGTFMTVSGGNRPGRVRFPRWNIAFDRGGNEKARFDSFGSR